MNKDNKLMIEPPIRMKTVSVGDVNSGKTSLLSVACRDEFPQSPIPKVFQNYVADFQVDGKEVWLTPWDTAAGPEDDRRRPFFYADADVILICFSLESLDSFESVEKKWWLEIQQYCPEVSIVLVGTKKDLRDESKSEEDLGRSKEGGTEGEVGIKSGFVTFEQGRGMADKIGAFDYLECSAKTKAGVHALFPTAARAAIQAKKSKIREKKCCVL